MQNPAGQVRSALNNDPYGLSLIDLLAVVDEFVLECASSDDPELQIFQLEEELQAIYREGLVYSTLEQTEIFLAVLYHLGPILPSTSVISWFDLVLRPALREPKLPTQAVNHAKELIISSLQKANETYLEKVGDFRRRLMELYLLDAFNEGSGEDILEWAELTLDDRMKRTHWKHNLEDILLRFGNERPEDFLDEVDAHFITPSSRLQLFSLLNMYTDAPSFSSASEILPKHPLMQHILYSLLLDNSSTVATLGVTLLVKLLPSFAVNARSDLKDMLPPLLAILARIMCWKERRASRGRVSSGEDIDVDLERELEYETNPPLGINPNVQWERLEMTFNAAASLPPSSRNYFTMLYYLYPSNTLRFLRTPAQYLDKAGLPSPYVETWDQALARDEICRRSENLVREHSCHAMIIWRDADVELLQAEFWSKYTMAKIVSEASMQDLRHLALAIQARYQSQPSTSTQNLATQNGTAASADRDSDEDPSSHGPQSIRSIDLSSGKTIIYLADMVNINLVLKTNLNADIIQPSSQWPNSLFQTNSIPTSGREETDSGNVSLSAPVVPTLNDNASHVADAVAGLQREILVLRNDLNFELWMSRENSKHIGKLYEERVTMKKNEDERQGLYNKLRGYRASVNRLETELQEQIRKAKNAKNQYADWNIELQQKLKELRAEKKSWVLETATLRNAEKELQARFNAQGRLLADAMKELFDLQTHKKANQHKIDRLHDYEAQIQQFLNVQKTWDEDFAKFNAREDDVKLMQSQYKQMQMQLACMENLQADYDEKARGYRRQIQALEAQLMRMRQQTEGPSIEFAEQEIAAYAEDRARLTETNTKLRDENIRLREELEEHKAMVEVLKAQRTGRRGLIGEPRSPILSAPP